MITVELRHGYTLADIDTIARYAARTSYGQYWGFDDQYAAAWYGIVEHLYEAEHQPPRNQLVSAGRRAVTSENQNNRHHWGVDSRQALANQGSMIGFQRYWWLLSQPFPSPEYAVTERIALAQILPLLRPWERQALAALAAHGTYQAAAEALDMPLASYRAAVAKARNHFLAIWHEHESPSRVWRKDLRVNRYGEIERRMTAAKLREGQRSRRKRQAAAVTP